MNPINFTRIITSFRERYKNEVNTRFVPAKYLALEQFTKFVLKKIQLDDKEGECLIKEAISYKTYTYEDIIELMIKLKKKGVKFDIVKI